MDECYEASGYKASYGLNKFGGDENMAVMRRVIDESLDAQDAIHRIQRTWLFSVNISDAVKEKAVDWHLAEQRSRGLDIFRLSVSVQESPVSFPGNNVERHGRHLNPNFLRSVTMADRLSGHLEHRRERLTVFELGGGLGHLAHVLKTLHPTTFYVIVDLPDTLFFSYQFLKLTIPTALCYHA